MLPATEDDTTKRYAEIKPLSLSGILSGQAQLFLRARQFRGTRYELDIAWIPSKHIVTAGSQQIAFFNLSGLVLYTDRTDLLEDVLAITTIQAAKVFFARYGTQSLMGALGRIPQLVTARVTIDNARLDSQIGISTMIASMGFV